MLFPCCRTKNDTKRRKRFLSFRTPDRHYGSFRCWEKFADEHTSWIRVSFLLALKSMLDMWFVRLIPTSVGHQPFVRFLKKNSYGHNLTCYDRVERLHCPTKDQPIIHCVTYYWIACICNEYLIRNLTLFIRKNQLYFWISFLFPDLICYKYSELYKYLISIMLTNPNNSHIKP